MTRRQQDLEPIRESTRPPNATFAGLLVGIALGFAGAFGGFVAFLVVLVLATAGTVMGLMIDGRIDLSGIVKRDRDGR